MVPEKSLRQFNINLSAEGHRLVDVLQRFYGVKSKADFVELLLRKEARALDVEVLDTPEEISKYDYTQA